MASWSIRTALHTELVDPVGASSRATPSEYPAMMEEPVGAEKLVSKTEYRQEKYNTERDAQAWMTAAIESFEMLSSLHRPHHHSAVCSTRCQELSIVAVSDIEDLLGLSALHPGGRVLAKVPDGTAGGGRHPLGASLVKAEGFRGAVKIDLSDHLPCDRVACQAVYRFAPHANVRMLPTRVNFVLP